jgi:AhpD family alkylhydroperoxidase
MPRVTEKKSGLARFSDWYSRKRYGRSIEITGVLAHNPWNLIGWGALEFGYEHSGKLEERLKDLAATKVATKVGCQFCIDIGSALGREAGVTEQQLREFHSFRESTVFSPVERVVMEYAEAMTEEPVDVPDELVSRLHEHFDDAQIVELTAAIAIENFRSRFNNALDIRPANFSEGQFCPLPDRAAAQAQTERTTA